VSSVIASWVKQARFEQLPEELVSVTSLRVLDVIGLAIAGGETPFGQSVRRSASLYPGTQARLWGTAGTASVPGGAFVNGALSQALEYDDTHNESIVHMSGPSVAAALSLTDERGASGRELLTAVAIGNEISSRAGSVTPGEFHKRGFHPSGLFAPFGTASLSAWLLGCEAAEIRNALGIVGSFAAGLIQCWVDGTQSKFLHPGWAAQAGIVAATLAHEHATGPGEVFEGRFGLFSSHLQDEGKDPDFGRLTRNLGTSWDSLNASFKPFPAAHVIHPYISALLRLRERHQLRAEEIAKITCPVAPYIVGIVCEPTAEKRRPLSDSHGRVSLQYTLAEALVAGRLGRDAYAPASRGDPVILGLADRVEYVVDEGLPGPEQFKGIVEVELADGTRFTEVEECNRGSASNPMTEEEIVAKFLENVAGVLSNKSAHRLVETALGLRNLDDVRVLTKLTVPGND
jgi:2-methylcitrate dehydratase PrpD